VTTLADRVVTLDAGKIDTQAHPAALA